MEIKNVYHAAIIKQVLTQFTFFLSQKFVKIRLDTC